MVVVVISLVNDLNDDAADEVNITTSGTTKVNNAAEATTFTGFPDTAFTWVVPDINNVCRGIQTGVSKTVTIDTGVTLKSDAVKFEAPPEQAVHLRIKSNEDPSAC